ncbi:MAG: DUF5723 family protein [Saprospiraceae bacterium]
MKNLFFIIIIITVITPAFAQQELGTHLLRDVWQVNRTNPAIFPDQKLIIGLPGVYNNLNINNITYNDLFTTENGQTKLNVDNAILKLDANNQIRENLEVETVSLAFRLGKFWLSAGHSIKFNAYIDYPKTLPQLIWQGNAQFLGQNVDFSTNLQLFGYNEFAFGAAIPLTENITIGGKLKWLSGFGDVSTDRTKLNLLTEEEAYALTLDADFRVNSTGSIEYNGLRDITINYDINDFDGAQLFNQNNGVAFDFGVYAKFGKLDLAASVLDLGGKINWEEDPQNFSLMGSYAYQGLDIAKDVIEDSTTINNAIDSLFELYDFTETNNAYSTSLPLRYYLSASYQLNDTWRFGGMIYGENYRGESFPGVAVSGNMQLLSWLNLGASYAFRSETFDNLGVNATAKLGPIQLFSMTDNILSALKPKDSHSANVRVGLNLLF